MEINRNNIMEIVKNAGLKPDKDYGQNFLIEPEVSSRIVEAANIVENDEVLEIGPGLGSLTHFISLKNVKTTVVDIDRRMIDFLSIFYKEKDNFTLIENDIRKTKINTYTKIIGNLPYNITTELVTYLLKYGAKAEKMVLMCQTEAFNRFYDLDGKEYGPVSVLVHLLGRSKKLFNVKGGCFYPVPKCGSTVFEIQINVNSDREECVEIFNLTKQLFLNRRKTILNNLTIYLKDKNSAEKVCCECNIPTTKRPEELSPEQYRKIYFSVKGNRENN